MPLVDTLRKRIKLPTKTWESSDNPLQWVLPEAGLLAGVGLVIRPTVAGTISAPNAAGAASLIANLRLRTSMGYDIVNLTGKQYNYILRYFIENNVDPVPHSTARNAVSAAAFVLDMYIPLAMNARDELGLFPLQVKNMSAVLELTKAANADIATGVTGVTGNVTPYITVYSVPGDRSKWPVFRALHQIIGETRTVTAASSQIYEWPTGNTFLQLIHGAGVNQSPADSWSSFKVRVGQSDYIVDETPGSLDIEFASFRGVARPLGLVPFDRMSSSGLGNYGSNRDWIDTEQIADIESVIEFTGASVLETVRRNLVQIK